MNDTFGSMLGSMFDTPIKPAPVREVGKEIDPKDVKVGDEVRAEYKMQDTGDITVHSTRQGVVHSIGVNYRMTSAKDEAIYSNGFSGCVRIVLVKAKDEILEALKECKPGSVVQIEDDGAAKIKLTYVKTEATQSGAGRWSSLDSRYTSTSLVGDGTVRAKMQSLDQIIIMH